MIYISIGSNLGNRLNYLHQAISLLKERYLSEIKCSIILETEAILPAGAIASWNRPFLNMIVSGASDLSPKLLLQGLKEIEYQLGRPKNYQKWSPRVIDLDILLWDDIIINLPYLKIPHPQLDNRPFLLHLLAIMGVYRKSQTANNHFVKSFTIFPSLVGIVNVTSDSFSDGGLFYNTEQATRQVIKLANDGAEIIDIGAQSTRPKAIIQSSKQEYAKLKPVLDNLKSLMETGKIKISIDSFQSSVIRQIVEHYPISWINNVKGDLDDTTLKFIAQHKCSLCIMHSLGIPPKKNVTLPNDQSPINIIIDWASKNIEYLLSLGFSQQSIIIDPGIGFGKSPYQNINILRQVEILKSLGSPIIIGHSRKSYMEAFSTEEAKNRDIETIAISGLLQNKVDFLRVHNVADHMRFFVAQNVIQGGINV